MRRLPVHMLLLGCSGMLLWMQGCSTPAGIGEEESGSRSVSFNGRRGGVYRAVAPPEKGRPFRLPDDDAGALLSKVLPPTAPKAVLQYPIRPTPTVVPMPRFAEPRLALPAVTPDLPRVPEFVKKVPIRPEFVQEEDLEESFPELVVPKKPSFVTGKRTRILSEDATLPPPLPVMAQPVPDRVSLEDATMEVSTLATLAAVMPPRTKVTPYQRMTVPEPFEHHHPLTLSLPEELEEPQAAAPQPPKP